MLPMLGGVLPHTTIIITIVMSQLFCLSTASSVGVKKFEGENVSFISRQLLGNLFFDFSFRYRNRAASVSSRITPVVFLLTS